MDQNNNQINNQQVNNAQQANSSIQQPVIQPIPQTEVGQATDQQPIQYQNPKGKSHKTILLLLILLITVLGLAGYLVYANMNTSAPQAIPASDVQVVLPPTNTPTPTIAEDDFTIDDPEADIKILDDAAATL